MTWYADPNGQPYTGDRADGDPQIPDRPSPDHVWSGAEWQLPATLPNWAGLLSSLRGSAVYSRLYTAANDAEANTVAATRAALRASNPFTLLQDTMQVMALRVEAGLVTPESNTAALADLEFAIASLRLAMAETAAGDLSSEEITWINTQLTANGFGLQLS